MRPDALYRVAFFHAFNCWVGPAESFFFEFMSGLVSAGGRHRYMRTAQEPGLSVLLFYCTGVDSALIYSVGALQQLISSLPYSQAMLA